MPVRVARRDCALVADGGGWKRPASASDLSRPLASYRHSPPAAIRLLPPFASCRHASRTRGTKVIKSPSYTIYSNTEKILENIDACLELIF
jgi:hypothetical protein